MATGDVSARRANKHELDGLDLLREPMEPVRRLGQKKKLEQATAQGSLI